MLLFSVTQSCTPWTAACQTSLSFTISWSLLKLMSIESVMPSNRLIFYHPLLFLPSIFPSIRNFSNELALPIMWSKYWSFSLSISPSNKYSESIFFRIDWFDLLAIQETCLFYLIFGCAGSSLLLRLFSSCCKLGLLSSFSAWTSLAAEHRLQVHGPH